MDFIWISAVTDYVTAHLKVISGHIMTKIMFYIVS